MEISIHALLAESDFTTLHNILKLLSFLSTLSLRRATESQQLSARPTTDFYPRSPCGERLYTDLDSSYGALISIHALLAESDALDISARREASISIHALLAESDSPIDVLVVSALPISIHALLAESDAAGVFFVILII